MEPRGETEGRKDRPVVLALLLRNRNDDLLVLMVPVTSVPQQGPYSIEVPDIEKRRAGLDPHMSLWIVVDEANEDIPAKSFYFEPENRIGKFSSSFTKQVQALMVEALKARHIQRTRRP
ncbi:hypothetical protein [Sinorhizobium medicae]|uniref:Uncharacterized protein n=2 Tax=Sinorhizobium medicae TaxID=110321 RepID=A0A508X5F4_9HYPH|nr:hypothetical protein [Sinorhizobium medicae]MBO1960217.1 hypothetical protein [Sinorhizobium medicae]MDX0633774.1 hypothetical protein [Sinorhizobium medicae]MDX1162046.1 hypothetical protein [Sinorhizobium medicae]WQO54548.1 hypothetical protein U8C36_26980 [Sinorhizobium medicae]WQP40301.1 hypothetical protein U8C38_25345 [Sinorhizobium medicae]